MKWSEYKWPEWIPHEIRTGIKEFWSEDNGRGPEAWSEDNIQQRTPKTGQMIVARETCGNREAFGKWVHCWNNMGRLVLANGDYFCTSSCGIIKEL